MGCASSKTEELPAVILCRERLDYLSQALHQRYSFSEAHVAYINSLTSVGVSLHRFFDSSTTTTTTAFQPPPPVFNLPPHRKHPPDDSAHLSSPNSGSHLNFHSEDDDDDSGHLHLHDDEDDDDDDVSDSLHRHGDVDDVSSLPPRARGMMMYSDGGGEGGYNPYLYGNGTGYNFSNNNMNVNYMKKHVTPSVSYEQKPVMYETETVRYGDPNASSSSSSSNYYDYFGVSGAGGGRGMGYANPNAGYMYYGAPPPKGGGGGVYGGWNGGGAPLQQQQQVAQQQKAAPPPPPPPATSAWDFMNLFDSIDNHYPPYTPSQDSREVREEEGIPDLEDEDNFDHEVVKKVHGNQKLVDDMSGYGNGNGGGRKSDSKRPEKIEEVVGVSSEGEGGGGGGESSLYRARVSASSEAATPPVEYDVHVVDKKVVGEGGKGEHQGKGGVGRPEFRNVFEVVKEIQIQFERAASSGNELTKVLEFGKLRYHRKTGGAFQVSTKMLNAITPSLPSSSKDDGAVNVDEDVQLKTVNLSATLQKLYLWEKKLFEEVKTEEKMRVQHDRKSDRLKHLAEKGADPQKIESTRNVVRGLSTKIRIAIQIVDKISATISKLRDEELWPQLSELILGLSRMWKAMLECHHSQCVAIDGARGLDAIAFPSNPSDAHLEASLQLERDLLNWTCRFTEWINAQKGYVRALNRWLLKCIYQEPEETADGLAPFSPGRAGCPPVFVICNQWDQSLERISETSEKELIDTMRVFTMMVLQFRERDKGELRQRMTANREMERKVKDIEREDVRMQKKIVLASGDSDGGHAISGNVVFQSDTSSKTSLQAGLRHVFEAMDRFTADSVKVYDELLQRSEEVVREHTRVS